MDLGLDPCASAAEDIEPSRKARAVAPRADESVAKLMDLICKLVLNNSQQIRALRSIVINVWLLPRNNLYWKAIKQATKAWQEKIDKVPKGRNPQRKEVGPPRIHAFNGALQCAKQVHSEDSDPLKKAISEALDPFMKLADSQARVEMLGEHVKYFHLAKSCNNKEHQKLEVSITDSSPLHALWDSIMKAAILADKGIERLDYVAPPGDMERKVQEWLERDGSK